MILSATSRHAIRALAQLAQVPFREAVLGRDLALRGNVPANFLSKIMLTLRNAGIVDATRGQGGGYRLVKKPGDITLMQVVELFDGLGARPSCFLGEKHPCTDAEACPAHAGWKSVCDAYVHFMSRTTIADIGLNEGCPYTSLHNLST
jgi:Rrf2 family iron-sulfur cluster assembly transcriptional regulator